MISQTDLYGTRRSGLSNGAQIIHDDYKSSDGPGPEVMDATTLTGDSVVNAAGENLGTIEAIMLDVASGRVAYAVLSFGGFLGLGAKLFALPWTALTLDAAEKRFVLDASKEKLENAEGFDKDRWPSMADPEWAARLHAYWRPEGVGPDAFRSPGRTMTADRTDRTTTY